MFRRGPDPRDTVIEQLMKQNADLLDRLQELIGQIHLHQVTRATAEAPAFAPQPRPGSTFEDEHDVRYAYDTGQITEAEMEQELRGLGFMGTEVEFIAP